MKKELKQAIVNFIFENLNASQLTNGAVDKFRAYIYDNTGNYLIGGEDVYKFITDAIELLTNKD